MTDNNLITRAEVLELVKAVESLSTMQNILRKEVDRLNSIVKDGDLKPSILETLAQIGMHVDNINNELGLLKQDLITTKDYFDHETSVVLKTRAKDLEYLKELLNKDISFLKNSITTKDNRSFEWRKVFGAFLLGALMNLVVLLLTGVI